MNKYSSFLVCFHENHSDFYLNGLSLGIVKSNEVELSKANPFSVTEYKKFSSISELRVKLNEELDKLEKAINLK